MFGAPVSLNLHASLREVMPQVETYTPYGATEALPVSWISGSEVLHTFRSDMLKGKGVAVGKVVDGTVVRIVDVNEQDIPPFHVGDIVVKGPQVTQSYFQNQKANAGAKIQDSKGDLWHRMGDVGFLDDNGLLWFAGRKNHQFMWNDKMFHSVPVELIFDQHPSVLRSALITVFGEPCVVFEREDRRISLSDAERKNFREELLRLAQPYSHTHGVTKFFLHPSFPVDCRHNIKIDRQALGKQCEQRLNEFF